PGCEAPAVHRYLVPSAPGQLWCPWVRTAPAALPSSAAACYTVSVTLADWSARAVQRVGRCVLQLPALSACGDEAEPDEGEGGVMEGHRGARGWSPLG